MSIDQYSTTPGNNDLVNYFKTGMRPSAVKNAGWDIMADIASYIVSLPTAGGTANALTVANGRPFGALVAGLTQILNPASVNTGAASFAPDGLATAPIHAWGKALVGGEIQIGVPAIFKYDGTNWNLQNPANGYNEITIFTANGNFTPKITGNYLVVGIGGGGGGGGGGGSSSTNGGGGGIGGAGGQLGFSIVSLTANTSCPVVIGAAGTSGTAGTANNNGSDGGAGGNTTFNGATIGAGGSIGRGAPASASAALRSFSGSSGGGNGGGQGGVFIGSSNIPGQPGGNGVANTGGGGGGGSGGGSGGTAQAGGAGGTGGTGILIVIRV